MRCYKPKLGTKPNKKHDPKTVISAIEAVKSGSMTIGAAAKHFKISKSALHRKVTGKGLNSKGGQKLLSSEFEEELVNCLLACSDYNMMLTIPEVQLFVKYFIDHKGWNIKKFKNNRPGVDWVRRFLRDNRKITNRMCPNVKKVRYNQSPESLNRYFDNLEVSVKDVPACNIINYDETNFTDDPKAKFMLMRRGVKYPSNEMNFSKSSTTVMYAGSAAGVMVPPYVIFKATHLYASWCSGGPKGASYNRSQSGWIDGLIFVDWLKCHLIPWIKQNCDPGIKVLIGDNLSSHISPEALKLCDENDIRFVLLEPNSTDKCQPLDVAVFRPVKILWRKILGEWKEAHLEIHNTLPKEKFPALLKQLVDKTDSTITANLVSGFKACGIFPCDRNEVMKDFNMILSPDELGGSLVTYLKDQRQVKMAKADSLKVSRGKKLNLEAGKSVKEEDLAKFVQQKAKPKGKKRAVKVTNKESNKRAKKVAVSDLPVDGLSAEATPGPSSGGMSTLKNYRIKKNNNL